MGYKKQFWERDVPECSDCEIYERKIQKLQAENSGLRLEIETLKKEIKLQDIISESNLLLKNLQNPSQML